MTCAWYPKICATDQIFGFIYVSSFTAVNFDLTNLFPRGKFRNEFSFPELLQRIYLRDIDFYSRSTVTADSQPQPLGLAH